MIRRNFHDTGIETDFWPMDIAHSQRHRSVPGARGVDGACSLQIEAFDLAGEVSFRQDQEFVQRLDRNVFGGQVHFRIQRGFCFA